MPKKDEKAEEPSAEEQIAASQIGTASETPEKGKEHWGEGGSYRIDSDGRRVRVKEKG